MSDTKFTPGPWSVRAGSGSNTGMVSIIAGTEAIASLTTFQIPDAYLISAAPDLYAALAWVRNNVGLDMAGRLVVDDALAKARGETA